MLGNCYKLMQLDPEDGQGGGGWSANGGGLQQSEASLEEMHNCRNFSRILEATFALDGTKKNKLFRESEKLYCSELFRFYSAIADWEKLYHEDPKRARLSASKLVSNFVDSGARYENGGLSSQTRVDLITGRADFSRIDARFFKNAKDEVARDITMDPRLRSIVEHVIFGEPTMPMDTGPSALLKKASNTSSSFTSISSASASSLSGS